MIRYVEDVLTGKIVVGRKIKLACQRFKSDLKRSKNDEDFPYYYDENMARKACKFVQMLPLTNGGKFRLAEYQEWIVSELYGWRVKETGERRYTQGMVSMARKSGKTYLAASLAAIGLMMENKPAKNRQVLFVSNALKQAKLGYDMLSSSLRQVQKSSRLIRHRIKVQKERITDLPTDSFATALASDTNTLDGYAGTTIILDEYAAAKDRKVYDVLKSGQAQEPNSLLLIISTSGLDLNAPMYAEYQMLSDVLAGKKQADRYFIAIWELDDRKEVTKPKTWIKANPIFEIPSIKQRMAPKIKDDVNLGIAQDDLIPVLTKNFNMWLQAADNSYISVDDWDKAEIQKPNTAGCDVYIGFDMSKTNDLTAISWIIPIDGRFYVDSHSFVGTKYGLDQKIKRDGFDYRIGEKRKECSITTLDSGVIDIDAVFDYLQNLINVNQWNVKAICYDPWNFNNIIAKCERAFPQIPLIEIRQGTLTLNVPTREFRDNLFQRKIIHSDNRLLRYSMINARIKEDNNGWQLQKKSRNSNSRIDPAAALMNAYVIARKYFSEHEQVTNANDYYTSDQFTF
ncbi:terminase large subunit [Limosilactobacillus reuteri]|uniref:terminase large subunit n=1 Tax=Limosilactobacillus reuteri TaxID=1598 RepID=UPI001E5A6FA6|nr:terminase TerL endonuclease subunit [Limosilactobacillus reuteri]MCC4349799.1 terminase large subunit [Limosilactobacillus reuteri]MCC4360917.1 terminase large subunit [Limosilactobacillus reuteri]MCC4379248.1 terminase large subunit [Limosilactobacillus reuteri]MCC4406582.1 terminase large subunit [Limosilactobacillus reuteri]MCC4416097.1 terminase large subunit [Limosilactobacillus reuteri]